MVRSFQISAVLVGLCLAACAQDPEPSLGDLARSLRKSKPPVMDQIVIDNDNFAAVMDKAESARLNGEPVFSIDPTGSTFSMISPDGSCSLSFDAKSFSPRSAAYASSDLPQDELAKLAGPASIHQGDLQISLHNGTGWELKEIVVGVTVLLPAAKPALQNASVVEQIGPQAAEKLPDTTVLYHLKGTAAPDSTSVFTATIDPGFPEGSDWHWAIVGARGIPPAAPPALGPQVPPQLPVGTTLLPQEAPQPAPQPADRVENAPPPN